MKCLQCGGPLEYAGQHAEHARCTHCLSMFTNGKNGLTPLEVRAPNGQIDPAFTAVFAQQLGFAPRQASHQTFNVGGVGLKVNTSKLEREAKNKLSGLIWGAAIGLCIIILVSLIPPNTVSREMFSSMIGIEYTITASAWTMDRRTDGNF